MVTYSRHFTLFLATDICIWSGIYVICATTISSNLQLWYCIAVFLRLYPSNTYLPNTDYTDYTDNRVVFIIWKDNVNAIWATTISSSLQLWYCIAVFARLYPPNNYLPNTDYTDYTGYRVVLNHRYRRCTDSVNVICSDDKNDSIISVISVISVWQVGSAWRQPREYSNTII